MSSRGKYNRYVTYQDRVDVNTKGSMSFTWSDTFTSYARKEGEKSSTSDAMEKRTTESKSSWTFPFNEAIKRDGRFSENNAGSKYYYIVGLTENEYQTEITVETELRV